jgi:hypothetical protein
MQSPTIDQTGRPELPETARAERARALALVRGGGGGMARGAAALARFAGMAAAPVSRAMGVALGMRRRAGGAGGSFAPTVAPVVARAMERAFDFATLSMPDPATAPRGPSRRTRARLAAIASGLAGGALGLPGFLPDAAFTTLLILRTIAAIAAREGEDLASDAARHACIEVFTLGAPLAPTAGAAAAAEQEGYWTARLLTQGTPLMALIRQAAARFGMVLSEKLAAQAVPLAGAAGGALVNAAFLAHYRALAEGHFIIRRLERTYGAEAVRGAVGL